MKDFDKILPDSLKTPTALPVDKEDDKKWQEQNKSWWENHPMRYDWNEELKYEEFSKEFYEEIDRRFFSNANEFLPYKKIPFEKLIDFESLKNKNVLEIGVGNGSHAGLLAKYSGNFTGIDLTDYAVRSTTNRMKVFGLNATILKMDAQELQFENNTFDFIWSWGVIHHSANTRKILEEIKRVLKPGGESIIMVYHRSIWSYYIASGFIQGILLGKLFKYGSLKNLVQNLTDGFTARHYSIKEWRDGVKDLFEINYIKIFGSKSELFPIPAGKLKNRIMSIVPNAFTRFLTNTCRQGTFIVNKIIKKIK